MSSMAETFPAQPAAKTDSRWSLWLRQVNAIMRLEVEKNFLGKRAALVYLLAFMPIGLLLMIAILPPAAREWLDFAQYPLLFSIIYNALILRTVVFFGCAWIFMNLFRGEIVDRSLHYYFLSAVRRDVLMAGKYFSGFLFGEHEVVSRWSRTRAATDVRRHYHAGLRRIRRVFLNRGPVLSQSDYSGVNTVRLGGVEFSLAATAEESKRNSLPQLTCASPGF